MSYFEGDERAQEILQTLPPLIRRGIVDYVNTGCRMGSFLTSVFANDLFMCLKKADAENKPRIEEYVSFIHWHCPRDCHGSYEKISEWIKQYKG